MKAADKNTHSKTLIQRELIIDYLTKHITATSSELEELIDVKNSRIKEILRSMAAEEIIVANSSNRNRTFSLKS